MVTTFIYIATLFLVCMYFGKQISKQNDSTDLLRAKLEKIDSSIAVFKDNTIDEIDTSYFTSTKNISFDVTRNVSDKDNVDIVWAIWYDDTILDADHLTINKSLLDMYKKRYID